MQKRTVEVDFSNTYPSEPEIKRDKCGRWLKGQSGNPKGTQGKRSKISKTTMELFTNNTDEALRNLLDLMDSPDPAVRLNATKYFLDKGLGRDFQAFEPLAEDSDTQMTINIVSKQKPDTPNEDL